MSDEQRKLAAIMFNRALEISPGNQNAIAGKAAIFQNQGRLEEAAKQLALIPADSADDEVMAVRMNQAEYERRFDAAIALIEPKVAALRPGESLSPLSEVFLLHLGYCQEWAGRLEQTRASFAHAVQALKSSSDSAAPAESSGALSFFLALAYAGLGDKTNALEQAHHAVAEAANDAIFKPLDEVLLAQIQARFGDFDAAIAALPHLLEVPAGLTPALLRLDPYWDPLRNDPRFQKLCQEKQGKDGG